MNLGVWLGVGLCLVAIGCTLYALYQLWLEGWQNREPTIEAESEHMREIIALTISTGKAHVGNWNPETQKFEITAVD